MVSFRYVFVATVIGLAILLPGCPPAESYRTMLQSPDPRVRAKGCIEADHRHDRAMVPLLVDRLEDRDAAVRSFAEQALRSITGQDFRYRESDPPKLRAEAVSRWRRYAASVSGDLR